jgi:hypothetical protein
MISHANYTIRVITVPVNWYNNGLFLIPNTINNITNEEYVE